MQKSYKLLKNLGLEDSQSGYPKIQNKIYPPTSEFSKILDENLIIFSGVREAYIFVYSGELTCLFIQGIARTQSPLLRNCVPELPFGNRRRQPNQSAMEGPLPGRTTLLIMVSPVPGKYDWLMFVAGFVWEGIV